MTNSDELALRMDAIEDELTAAQRAGDVSSQIALLRERALIWRRYGALLAEQGRDNHGALLAAQRDTISADHLVEGAL